MRREMCVGGDAVVGRQAFKDGRVERGQVQYCPSDGNNFWIIAYSLAHHGVPMRHEEVELRRQFSRVLVKC